MSQIIGPSVFSGTAGEGSENKIFDSPRNRSKKSDSADQQK